MSVCNAERVSFSNVPLLIITLGSAFLARLVAASRSRRIVDPVKNDERQAANHEDDAHYQENDCLWTQGNILINYLSQLAYVQQFIPETFYCLKKKQQQQQQ